jgi:hypothetical protein
MTQQADHFFLASTPSKFEISAHLEQKVRLDHIIVIALLLDDSICSYWAWMFVLLPFDVEVLGFCGTSLMWQ